MGDEDWDTELTSTPSFTSDFSKLKTENSFTTNEGSGFRGGNDVNKSDAPSRGGLGAGRGFGFQRGNRSEGDSSSFGNRSDGGSFAFGNRSRGGLFGRGGFKGKSEDAASDSGFGDNGPRRNGSFSKRGDDSWLAQGDILSMRIYKSWGSTGFGDGNDDDDLKDRSANKGFSHSEDRFGERRGRGAGRGGRGGFGRSSGDGNVDELGNESGGTGFDHSEDGFGERRGRGAFRGTRGGFGRRFENGDEQSQLDSGTRGRLGSPSSFEGRGRGGGFGGRGGFKGRNEDVGSDSGQAADGCAWKADEEESGDKPARVTYVPPPPPDTEDGIFAHYQTGINFDKYDDIPVQVSGLEPPPAILTFEEANLPETLNSNISKAGYMKLTPVQKYGIPIVLAGRDLMACAQTGSGKTAAFLLPILAHMLQDGIAARSSEPQEPEAIIIAPTRELINQIFLDARKFAYGTCVRPVVVYGGMQPIHAIRQIYQGCNILCATPGRLLDIIKREKIGLTKLRFLVLDEADRMLDMGFGPDMKALISSPGMPTKDQRQTLMYSATFPEDIQSMAREFLKSNYLFVAVGQVGGACSDVEQQVLEVGQYDKKNKLIGILQELGKERTMVFVETKKKADFLTTMLCQEKVSATSIHGDRLQREREEALADFRLGKCNVLVATNVAARGLDIENVQHVINFDLSKNVDEYVHRIGRTGRCGNTGRAITFFDTTEDRDLARPLVKVLSDAQQEVPAWLEEIAFSSHGSYSSRGSTFASVDTRKDFSTKGPVQSAFAANDDDASWD